MTTYRRVLITGHRKWPRPVIIVGILDGLLAKHGALTIVHGGNGNVDLTAHGWAAAAKRRGLSVEPEPHLASWNESGRAAGFIRNQEMVDTGIDECHAFTGPCMRLNCPRPQPHDSHGTTDCVRRARTAGIPVTIHEWPAS